MSDNMRYYDKWRKVPEEAKKPILAGRLKGMTDINPVFRIKALTEIFGPCGVGWWYDVTNKELVRDEQTKQTAAFVDILLYFKDPETGEVSHGIPGTGGASFISQERNGAYLSDECYKMALTDALSVSCKALGIAADVYWQKDRTKYSVTENNDTSPDARKGPSRPTSTQPKESVARPQKTADRPQRSGLTQPSQQMATSEQKTYIIDHASDEDYMAIMQKYGAELETLTEKQADAVIKKLDDKAKAAEIPLSTTVTCERCGNPITGQALPDGTLMSASEIIGKSKVQYNGVYCFSCCKELKAARKAG